jgi:hypothetical protein
MKMPETAWRLHRGNWSRLWRRLAPRLAERCANALNAEDEAYARKMARWHRRARDREDMAYFESESELAELPGFVTPQEGFR